MNSQFIDIMNIPERYDLFLINKNREKKYKDEDFEKRKVLFT